MNVHLPAPHSKWPGRLLNLAVVLLVLALAAATFVLSYAGVHAIVRQAGVSVQPARLYPGVFDAVLVIACVAALMLRDARWWTRLYAWLVIIAVVAVVGAADAVHAMNVALPHRTTEGVVAAAPWVLALLGFSLMLTMFRHSRAQHAGGAASASRAAERALAELPPAAGDAPAAFAALTEQPTPTEPSSILALLTPADQPAYADQESAADQPASPGWELAADQSASAEPDPSTDHAPAAVAAMIPAVEASPGWEAAPAPEPAPAAQPALTLVTGPAPEDGAVRTADMPEQPIPAAAEAGPAVGTEPGPGPAGAGLGYADSGTVRHDPVAAAAEQGVPGAPRTSGPAHGYRDTGQEDGPAEPDQQPSVPEIDLDAPPFATAPFAAIPRLNRIRSTPTPPEDEDE